MERRLAAILAADVVGYSRLMEADEEATARTLSTYQEIIEGLVASHHGRVFGSAGDNVIAEFAQGNRLTPFGSTCRPSNRTSKCRWGPVA